MIITISETIVIKSLPGRLETGCNVQCNPEVYIVPMEQKCHLVDMNSLEILFFFYLHFVNLIYPHLKSGESEYCRDCICNEDIKQVVHKE